MTIRALRPDEFDEHAELVFVSYTHEREAPEGSMLADRGWWLRSIERDPFYEPAQTRVMQLDGRLVASVTCYLRPTYVPGRQAKAACIGSVCTHPDYRRRGLVRQVLDEAAAWMTAEGFEWSWLYGKYEVYGGSGWQNLSTWDTHANLRLREDVLGEVTLRPADPDADLPLLMRVHEAFSGRLAGPTARSEQYWRRRVLAATPWGPAPTYEVAEASAEAVGYVCMSGASVREIGWLDRPHGLLAAIMTRMDGEPVHFGFSLPELTAALRDISAIPTQQQCFREPGGVELREAYRGLWRSHAADRDTESLVRAMRDLDYVMWPADRA